MADKPECRIVARTKDGKTELSVYEPHSGRHHQTGWTESQAAAPAQIVKLKEQLERAGNRVSVKEIDGK